MMAENRAVTRAFVLEDEGALAGVLTALGQAFTVTSEQAGRGRRRRSWLDAFDWRLRDAGLVLEHEQTRHGARLILTGRDGLIRAEQPVTGWQSRRPSRPAALPPGPVKDAIAPLLAPRALLPVARAVTIRTVERLRNADGKTVARLHLDRTTASPAAQTTQATQATQLALLSIVEVRGYPGQARRAAGLIETVPGVHPAEGTVFDAVLSALGHDPESSAGTAGITADMPAPVAVATVLLNLLGTLDRNVDGVLRDIDTEFLHDLRVAVRRTRAGIKLLGDVLPADLVPHHRDEFKWLGDLTTPVRDLDVHLLGLDDLAASLVAATPQDLEPFRAFLASRRVQEFRRLRTGLRSARFRVLTHDWRKALLEVRDLPARRRATRPTSALAAERTAKAVRQVVKRGTAITVQSPPESLHDLRKRCKELRYLLEFFGPLYQPGPYKIVTGDLKKLQDGLGEFQDSQVQRQEIAFMAEAMFTEKAAPASTLLAMGEIAARLAVSQHEARDGFARRFASFAAPASQERIRELQQ
jgi:CHAD domain-containing protein